MFAFLNLTEMSPDVIQWLGPALDMSCKCLLLLCVND